jgi:hypothetical protein
MSNELFQSKESEFIKILTHIREYKLNQFFVLIGSWAMLVYKENPNLITIKRDVLLITKDIDFSIKRPRDSFPEVNFSRILVDLGYNVEFSMISGSEKYKPQDFSDNQLEIEFLCPYGRHIQDPFRINNISIKVTPLVYQDALLSEIITAQYKGIEVNVPHPLIWAAHKIAISQDRKGKNKDEKKSKDLTLANIIVTEIGHENFYKQVEMKFRGKLLKLFQKGWLELLKKDINPA